MKDQLKAILANYPLTIFTLGAVAIALGFQSCVVSPCG